MRFAKIAPLVAVLAIAAAACGSSAVTNQPGSSEGSATQDAATPRSTFVMPAGGNGSCNVDVKGDKTVAWQSKQDMGSLLVSYWLKPADKTMLALKDGEASLIMNCQSSTGSLSFTTPAGTKTSDFTLGPKEYVIPKGGLLGGAEPGQLSVLVNLKDKDIWKVIEAGSLKVTTFGGSKFAGSFSFKIGKVGDNLSSIVGTATVTGTFDLSCTGSACS